MAISASRSQSALRDLSLCTRSFVTRCPQLRASNLLIDAKLTREIAGVDPSRRLGHGRTSCCRCADVETICAWVRFCVARNAITAAIPVSSLALASSLAQLVLTYDAAAIDDVPSRACASRKCVAVIRCLLCCVARSRAVSPCGEHPCIPTALSRPTGTRPPKLTR